MASKYAKTDPSKKKKDKLTEDDKFILKARAEMERRQKLYDEAREKGDWGAANEHAYKIRCLQSRIKGPDKDDCYATVYSLPCRVN